LEPSKEDCSKIQERLAAWIQYQHDMTARISSSLEQSKNRNVFPAAQLDRSEGDDQ
jgi:hypothetical protein